MSPVDHLQGAVAVFTDILYTGALLGLCPCDVGGLSCGCVHVGTLNTVTICVILTGILLDNTDFKYQIS